MRHILSVPISDSCNALNIVYVKPQRFFDARFQVLQLFELIGSQFRIVVWQYGSNLFSEFFLFFRMST